MKPRCTWTGYLKISLVTVPVRVYTAISATDKITFNQLHKSCHQRIRQKLVCPVHGEVERTDLVKGYEYATDEFVILSESDLEAVRLETTGTIELVQFVRPAELDPMFLDTPYYVGPDGPVAEEGFGVVREALRRTKRIGIGRVVLNGKEKLVALKPLDRGFVFFTLRYVAEVRPATAYFDDLSNQPLDVTQVALAQQLIDSKSGTLDLASFTDRYQTALLDLIKGKVEGTAPVLVPRNEVGHGMGLMEALRQSVAQTKPEPKPMVRSNAAVNGHVLPAGCEHDAGGRENQSGRHL
jgi:DNA end-binding protein Ku